MELVVQAFWIDGVHYFDPVVFSFQEASLGSGLKNCDPGVLFKVMI